MQRLALALLVLFASLATAKNYDVQGVSGEIYLNDFLRFYPESAGAVDFDRLTRDIKDNDVRTLRQLVDLFASPPELKYKQFLFDSVLLHHSESSQKRAVTPETPRAVLYGDRMMMALVDNPSVPEGRRLEVIELDPVSKQFKFHQIEFAMDGSAPPKIDEHPTSCKKCHDDRPIWGSYPLWPGVYNQTHPVELKKGLGLTKDEKLFEHFKKNGAKGPVYSKLNIKQYENTDLSFTYHVDRLNNLRLSRLIRETRNYDKMKYALMGAMLSCEPIHAFLPENLRAQASKRIGKDLAAVKSDTEQRLIEDHDVRVKKMLNLSGATRADLEEFNENLLFHPFHNEDLQFVTPISSLRYLVEGLNLSYQPFSEWAMRSRPGVPSYSFSFQLSYGAGLHNLINELIPDVEKGARGVEVPRAGYKYDSEWYQKKNGAETCEALKKASLNALTDGEPHATRGAQPFTH